MNAIHLSLRGYIVGPIWWPVGAECFKPLDYDITREDQRFLEPGTLRDHVLAALNDGDFQSTSIAQGELIAATQRVNSAGETITRERRWPLACFKSIADCLHDDPDWFPSYEAED